MNPVDLYAAAVRGLNTLEPDPERQLKYVDFVDIYTALDDNERQRYETEHPQEAQIMSTYLQRVREESEQRGKQQGEQRGVQKGEVLILLRQMGLKFGKIPDEVYRRVQQADSDTLLIWSERILTANSIDELMR